MSSDHPPVVIIGCGYVGTRLAQSLLADGIVVRVCARRMPLLEPLRELGAEVHYLDGSRPHQFGPALGGLSRPIVVYSIPGVPDLPQGEAVRRAATAASRAGASAFIYLSSSAVYGRSELVFTGDWVDEESSVATSDADALMRLSDEAAVQSVAQSGLRTAVLRSGAIYGPALDAFHGARGARQRLRNGQYKLWDGGRHYFSRIYIDDFVRIIRRAGEKAAPGSIYVVGDDHPCPQREYGEWLAEHLHLPAPPEADPTKSGGPRNVIRGRRLRNDKLKRELDITLLYPSYREGELAIDAAEQGVALPQLRMTNQTPLTAPSTVVSEPVPPASVPAPVATPVSLTPPMVAQAPVPEAVTTPTWPKPVDHEDFGTVLGHPPRGIRVVHLKPGTQALMGPAYVLVSGAATATVDGQAATLRAWTAVPAGAQVQAESDVVLLALMDPTTS